jgi:hypothetical protein
MFIEARQAIMCGRYTQNYTWQQVHEFLSVFGDLPAELDATNNVNAAY